MWIVLVDWYTPIADVKELDLLADAETRNMGLDLKSLLPPGVGIYRLSHHRKQAHQAPDFQAWVDRLPGHWRVLILAISPLTHLDGDSVADLSGAVAKLRSQDRRMLLCGVTPAQFKVLRKHGFLDQIEVEDVCPDLEFAIARSLEVVRHSASRD
jgi:anti-anti-sigma regulatory factor